MEKELFSLSQFANQTGYLFQHEQLALGHTAQAPPWSDPAVHLHQIAEEAYLLLQGQLVFLVGQLTLTLRPGELLLVKPQIPHAIVGGQGKIEHIGLRAPGRRDKEVVGEIPGQPLPPTAEATRELGGDWGYRIPLNQPENQTCWLLGFGQSRFLSDQMILAWLNFPTFEAANAGLGTRHRPHLHQQSWEYYGVLEGTKTLLLENELVTLSAGELLGVPPGVCHNLHGRQAPYRGFTLRVPIVPGAKVECIK